MKRYRESRWMRARYAGKCAKCGQPFNINESIFYRTDTKRAYSGQCCPSDQTPYPVRQPVGEVSEVSDPGFNSFSLFSPLPSTTTGTKEERGKRG
jgi:hypothetical protein